MTEATNVAAIQTSGRDPIDAAFDAAIAELERLDANGHTTADLIEAREQYRQERSAGIDEIDAAAREQDLHERITRVLGDGFCSLADYLKTGQPDGLDGQPLPELIEHATALAELLSHVDAQYDEVGDGTVPKGAHLLYSLLYICREVGRIELEFSIAQHRARMAAEQEGGSDE